MLPISAATLMEKNWVDHYSHVINFLIVFKIHFSDIEVGQKGCGLGMCWFFSQLLHDPGLSLLLLRLC